MYLPHGHPIIAIETIEIKMAAESAKMSIVRSQIKHVCAGSALVIEVTLRGYIIANVNVAKAVTKGKPRRDLNPDLCNAVVVL